MRRSVRERKTSTYFLNRNYADGIESVLAQCLESKHESEELENEEEEPEPFISPSSSSAYIATNEKKRKIEEVSTRRGNLENLPSVSSVITPRSNGRKKKISLHKSCRMFGNIEYEGKDGIKTSQLIDFQTNSDKGYHFDKNGVNGFTINNFAVGNYIFFFLKKSSHILYELLIKVTPNEHKIEITDDVLNVNPSTHKEYKKSYGTKYPSINVLISSHRDNHLQLIFRDSSDIPFCTFNIESSE
jgi:hypothetical protein